MYYGPLLMREIALFSNIYSINLMPYALLLSVRLLLPYVLR